MEFKHLKYCDKVLKSKRNLTDDERQMILLRLNKPKYENLSDTELKKIITKSSYNIVNDRTKKRNWIHFESKAINNEEVFDFVAQNVAEEYESLYEALELLSEDDKEFVLKYFFDGLTFEELGQKEGMSKTQARYKLNKILFDVFLILKKEGLQ